MKNQKMKKTKNEQFLNKINLLLQQKSCKLFVVFYDAKTLIFNTGRKLEEKEISSFKRILKNPYYDAHLIDIYQKEKSNGDIIRENLLKKQLSNSGKLCQKIHGDKIKKNLNSGIGYRKGFSRKGTPCTEENKKFLSESRKGENNPMWGRKYSEEYKENQSNLMKRLILEGKFTPNTNNRLTHFGVEYNGIKFRSSWEVVFYHFNKSFLYENLRIPYFDTKTNKQRIYIVDFVCHETKMVVEIKPKELFKETEICKITALHKWCEERGYKMKIYTHSHIRKLKNQISDYTEFDAQTKTKILSI